MSDQLNALRQQLADLKARHDAGQIQGAAYEKARAEIERRIVDAVTAGASPGPQAAADTPRAGKRLWITTALVTLVVAAGGYAVTGSPELIGTDTRAAAASGPGHEVTREQIVEMADRLDERMKERPDDPEGWVMLGRTRMVLDQPDRAVEAYLRALKLRPDDAAVLVDYADALAVKNGRDLAGEPLQLIERALKLEPRNLKALMLAGTAAFNRGDYVTAVGFWDRVPQFGPPDDPLVQSARAASDEARRRGNLPPASANAAPAAATPPAATGATPPLAGGPSLTGTVTLSAALKAQAGPDDTVFVFARPADGSRMPLAIQRVQVRDLPFEFRLDDSQAMTPAARLSTQQRVIVGARVSKSGQAMTQPGDLEGFSEPVAPGASGVRVEIGRVVP